MYVRPSAPLSIGGVIDDALRLYRAFFSRFWPMALGFTLLLSVLALVLLLSLPANLQSASANPQRLVSMMRSPLGTLSYLLMMLASLVYYGAVFSAQSALVRADQSFTAAAAAITGLRRFPATLVASILFLLAFVGGCVLLLVPGIYLWGKLQLWPAALFAEDAGPLQSLETSWRLTKGRWWRTVTIFSVAVILMYVLALIIGILPISMGSLSAMLHGNLLRGQLIALPFGMLSRFLITPLLPAVLLTMYHDCKLRSEGGDLAARVEALGST